MTDPQFMRRKTPTLEMPVVCPFETDGDNVRQDLIGVSLVIRDCLTAGAATTCTGIVMDTGDFFRAARPACLAVPLIFVVVNWNVRPSR